MAARRPHIVMLPFLGQGHLIPFLNLAVGIARRYPGRFTVTIVSTAANVQNLRSSVPADSGVLFRDLPFPASTDSGLPPGVESSDSVPSGLLLGIFRASFSLRPHFERLVAEDIPREEGRPPVCVVADVFMSWSVHVARRLGLFHATFTTCGCFGSAAYFSLWLHLPHATAAADDDDDDFGVPGFPETYRLRRSQLSWALKSAAEGDPWVVFLRELITDSFASDAMLCNTAEELEPGGPALLQKNTGVRVWSVGPVASLAAEPAGRRAGKVPGVAARACVEWLDGHPPRSVLYVCFGSQNSVSAAQMMALAEGLEASGRPFIWVLRPPFGFDVGEFRAEWLPGGFEERAGKSGRGLLVPRWAPQLEILSHRSVGAFLSHCGWNSTLESLGRGVPLIGWPMAAEQFYNSKMLEEELGVCVELARGVYQGVKGAEVERVISLAMGSEKGDDMRRRAAAAAETIRAATTRKEGGGEGPSLAALDHFLRTALKEETPPPSARSKPGLHS